MPTLLDVKRSAAKLLGDYRHSQNILERTGVGIAHPPEKSDDDAIRLACYVAGQLHDDKCIDRTTCNGMIEARDQAIHAMTREIAELKAKLENRA